VHDPAFTAIKYPHDHRRFYDICSMACLSKFANARPHAEARSADSVQADVGGSECPG